MKLFMKWLCILTFPLTSSNVTYSIPNTFDRDFRHSFILISFSKLASQYFFHFSFSSLFSKGFPDALLDISWFSFTGAYGLYLFVCVPNIELTLSWVHTRLASCCLSVTTHQGRLLMMLLIKFELFPPPTYILTLYYSTLATMNLLEYATFHIKSR